MKVISIVGARPQFIKAVLISNLLRKRGIDEILVHTGQHYDFSMSDVFFEELNLPEIDYYLGVGSGLHGEQTGKMLIEIEKILLSEKPKLVLVYGDTNTTLAGALASTKLHIPVAHIESGLRSFNKNMPEEINRILTDHISELLFCPSKTAVENLKKEGITKNVFLVGDIMLDIAYEISKNLEVKDVLNKYKLENKNFILVTVHRAENTDIRENLESIWRALNELANVGVDIIFPVHPRTYKLLKSYNLLNGKISSNLKITEPLSYKEMIALEKSARLIITDSGGVQKESAYWKTPCLIVRNETEWVELLNLGYIKLVGADSKRIVEEALNIFKKGISIELSENPYGDGKTRFKIVNIIENFLRGNDDA